MAVKTLKTTAMQSRKRNAAAERRVSHRAPGTTVVQSVGIGHPALAKPPQQMTSKSAKGASLRKAARHKKPAASKAPPTQPTASEIAEREEVARTFFNPSAAAAARAAFRAR